MIIIFVAFIILCVWFKYHVWGLLHPAAPFWTYFFSH